MGQSVSLVFKVVPFQLDLEKVITRADTIGFRFSPVMSPLNLDKLQSWIDKGRIDPSKPITLKELVESRCLHGTPKHGVKILAKVGMANISGFLTQEHKSHFI